MQGVSPIKFHNRSQKLIYNGDLFWFKKYRKEISRGKVLKAGYGLGYASYFIKLYNKKIVNVDISSNACSIFPQDVLIYDGVKLPFRDNFFDTAICTFTLHHAKKPVDLLAEIIRVSKNKIIIIEETYDNFMQKLAVVLNCWWVNKRAGQNVNIYWDNYFHTEKLKNTLLDFGLSIFKYEEIKTKANITEMYILKKHENKKANH